MFRLPYWIFFLLAACALAAAAALFFLARDPVLRPDPAEEAAKAAPVDIAEITVADNVGPEGELALMAQIPDAQIFDLGPIGPGDTQRFAYTLFSVFSDDEDRVAGGAFITGDRAGFEGWLRERTIGTAQLGPLYHLYGYTLVDRRTRGATVGKLSEAGLSTAREFFLMTAPFEADRPKEFEEPTRSELILPVLLSVLGGILMILGFHIRSLTRRAPPSGRQPL